MSQVLYSSSELMTRPDLAHAATQIQRIFRGSATRTRLAYFNSPYANYYALKIQRNYLRYRTKRMGLEVYYEHLCIRSTSIKLFYLQYRARLVLLSKRQQLRIRRITQIQCCYRRKLARHVYTERLRVRENMLATRVQRRVRGLLGRKYTSAIKMEYSEYVQVLTRRFDTSFLHDSARLKVRWADKWRGLREVLLLCMTRPYQSQFAIELCYVFLRLHPTWVPALALLQTVLLHTWVDYGRCHVTRFDLAELAWALRPLLSLLSPEEARIVAQLDLTLFRAFTHTTHIHTTSPSTFSSFCFLSEARSLFICWVACFGGGFQSGGNSRLLSLISRTLPEQSLRSTLLATLSTQHSYTELSSFTLATPTSCIHVVCAQIGEILAVHTPSSSEVRPLLLHEHEVRALQEQTEDVCVYIRDHLVLLHTGGTLVPYRLCLPCVESCRSILSHQQLQAGAAAVIQRVFRGFICRCLHHRLLQRHEALRSQVRTLFAHKRFVDAYLSMRNKAAATIQSLVRGVKIRIRMRLLVKSAITIQRFYIKLFTQRRLVDENKRQMDGPVVREVLRQGVRVGGRMFTAVVSRCEGEYKIVAYDVVRASVYEGFCYSDEVLLLLAEHRVEHGELVRPYQKEAVARVILSRLKMAFIASDDDVDLSTDGVLRRYVWLSAARNRVEVGKTGRLFDRSLQDQSAMLDKYRRVLRHGSSRRGGVH